MFKQFDVILKNYSGRKRN